jgi:hypothetical protein
LATDLSQPWLISIIDAKSGNISVRESCVKVDNFFEIYDKLKVNILVREELCRGGKNRIFAAKSGNFS